MKVLVGLSIITLLTLGVLAYASPGFTGGAHLQALERLGHVTDQGYESRMSDARADRVRGSLLRYFGRDERYSNKC